MQLLLIIVLALGIYFLKVRKQILKDKKERHSFYFFSILSIGMGVLIMFEVPIDQITVFFNHTLGAVTKYVIQI